MIDFIDIKGFSNYQINSDGMVMSFFNDDVKILKVHFGSNGYCYYNLQNDNGKKVRVSVHRLVANAFIPNKENKPQVNHKDGNKLNNSVSNLEWVTSQENINHYYKNLKP